MKVERITTDTQPHLMPQESERLAREEKNTLTSDAVTFDGQRRESGTNSKFNKDSFYLDNSEEEELPPKIKDQDSFERKIDIIA